jgi:tRNA (guanine-N7-)-methyltransferase
VIDLISEPEVAALSFDELFRRRAPVRVDLGCGDGSFLVALGAQIPEKNFLGIERLRNRVRSAIRKAANMDNIQVLRADTSFVVRHLLPEKSIEGFYLRFPDPWPKRRHHRRRIVTQEFLTAISTALEPDGFLSIATDHTDYFDAISQLALKSELFLVDERNGDDHLPASTFQRRFQEAGVPIHRLELRKVSPVT